MLGPPYLKVHGLTPSTKRASTSHVLGPPDERVRAHALNETCFSRVLYQDFPLTESRGQRPPRNVPFIVMYMTSVVGSPRAHALSKGAPRDAYYIPPIRESKGLRPERHVLLRVMYRTSLRPITAKTFRRSFARITDILRTAPAITCRSTADLLYPVHV